MPGRPLLERVLAVIDWIAAVPLAVHSAGALLLGVVLGVFALGNPGAPAAVAWSLASGLASGLGAGACAAAALAMRRGHPRRWWLQALLLPALMVLWTLALCATPGVAVRLGAWTLCGR